MEDKDNPKNTPAADNGTPNPSDNGGKKDGAQGDQTPKTFTQEEHQAELDRVAAKTRDEEKKKAEKETAKAVADAKAETERLAKLNEEERTKELRDKEQSELKKQKDDLDLRAARYDGIDKLNELKIPTKFIDFVINPDKDKMMENIDALSKEWTNAIAEAVKDQLKGNTPKAPGSNSNDGTQSVKTVF